MWLSLFLPFCASLLVLPEYVDIYGLSLHACGTDYPCGHNIRGVLTNNYFTPAQNVIFESAETCSNSSTECRHRCSGRIDCIGILEADELSWILLLSSTRGSLRRGQTTGSALVRCNLDCPEITVQFHSSTSGFVYFEQFHNAVVRTVSSPEENVIVIAIRMTGRSGFVSYPLISSEIQVDTTPSPKPARAIGISAGVFAGVSLLMFIMHTVYMRRKKRL